MLTVRHEYAKAATSSPISKEKKGILFPCVLKPKMQFCGQKLRALELVTSRYYIGTTEKCKFDLKA